MPNSQVPTGAQAQYQYALDGQNGPGFAYMWTEVLRNAVTRKSLTYQQQYDGNSTPVTETWNYDIALGTIVMPDGGVVSCTVRAFYGLSFPQPEGGIVTVVYPIMFSPGG